MPLLATLERQLEELVAALPGRAGVVVKELATGQALCLNASAPFPAASVIKLAILWTFFQEVEAGRLPAAERVTLAPGHQVGGSGVLQALAPGLAPTWQDLARLMIIVSDNMATNLLIDRLGQETINQAIAGLGLRVTCLQRKMMDYARAQQGFNNVITAEETVSLLEHIVTPGRLSPSSHQAMLEILRQQQLNDYLSRDWPEEVVFAHKTGTLSDAAHDAGILFLDGRSPLILVALTAGLADNFAGAAFCARLGRTVYKVMRTCSGQSMNQGLSAED
ncbi:MAG: class A beta-lactamase-related serine hydrolase [Chloroflexi bacterium]|nr:class A beta-lactamase-related serine hydrolase [Chloroflexota bacterium]MCI0581238.1 class A beta-lactamase-related serine hydrolase [Chloroflexota bacterium]MCI0646915.1 class A beta-lactamase-related serine hydrolase [Chloroflexota bacterium]MCI0731644.1 class A beta-lactamase-related serine hydrolase [Chloroflexota bacterium]